MEKKLHFAKVQAFKTELVSYREKASGDYIKSGDDNLFPQHLIELYNRSSVHGAATKAITEAIIGGGLTADHEHYLDKANTKQETWNNIFEKVAVDYKLHGAFALEIIWSLDRSRIAEVYHLDFSLVRAGEKDHRGYIPGYYIANEWKTYTKATDDNVHFLPTFNPALKQEQPNQIYISHKYTPGQSYYPLPDYNGALKVIELDTEIDNFHVNNIKNGLAPSLAITTYMNGAPDDVKAVERLLRENYGGTDNAGSLIYMDVDSPENAPTITPIQQNGADTYYTTINDMTVQKILTAHRITSPMILGIKTEGQLGGRTEIIDSYLLLQNTVIAPMQQKILGCLEYILGFNYPDIVLGVETKQLFDDGTVEEEVITSVETTDEEHNDINEETNDNDILNIGN